MSRRVLYVVHGMPPEENSGTTLVAKGYASSFAKKGWDVAVVYGAGPAEPWKDLLVRLSAGRGRSGLEEVGAHYGADDGFLRFEVPRTRWVGAEWALQAASARSGPSTIESLVFSLFLERFEPAIVHVIDDVNLPLDLPDVAARKGLPVVRTVSCAEDLCVNIAPVSPVSGPKGYCPPPLLPERCAACLTADPSRLGPRLRRIVAGEVVTEEVADAEVADVQMADESSDSAPSGSLSELLERKKVRAAEQYANVFDRIVFSTPGFREYFCESLTLDPRRVRVIGMGLDKGPWESASSRKAPKPPGSPTTFAMAGVFDVAKGHKEIVEAFSSTTLAGRDDWRLKFLGGGDPQVLGPLLNARTSRAETRVELHGSYLPEQLPELLGAADVGLAGSRFETFHRVTREYMLSGLPVVTSPTFGAIDLIRDGVNGLVFNALDPADLARKCAMLLDDPDLLRRLSAGASATKVRSIQEEAEELEALYKEVLEERSSLEQ